MGKETGKAHIVISEKFAYLYCKGLISKDCHIPAPKWFWVGMGLIVVRFAYEAFDLRLLLHSGHYSDGPIFWRVSLLPLTKFSKA